MTAGYDLFLFAGNLGWVAFYLVAIACHLIQPGTIWFLLPSTACLAWEAVIAGAAILGIREMQWEYTGSMIAVWLFLSFVWTLLLIHRAAVTGNAVEAGVIVISTAAVSVAVHGSLMGAVGNDFWFAVISGCAVLCVVNTAFLVISAHPSTPASVLKNLRWLNALRGGASWLVLYWAYLNTSDQTGLHLFLTVLATIDLGAIAAAHRGVIRHEGDSAHFL